MQGMRLGFLIRFTVALKSPERKAVQRGRWRTFTLAGERFKRRGHLPR
jgi:hypothetical protein